MILSSIGLISALLMCNEILPLKKCPNLAVVEIQEPEWNHPDQQTDVYVAIENRGKKASEPTMAILKDLDISYEEGVEMGLDTLYLEMIAENNGRADWYQEDNENVDEDLKDYDKDWEDTQEVPALKPGERYTIHFIVDDYWIYDSNCEIEVTLDPDEEIKDCDRENNKDWFFGWGKV